MLSQVKKGYINLYNIKNNALTNSRYCLYNMKKIKTSVKNLTRIKKKRGLGIFMINNFSGYIDTGSQFSAGLAASGLTNFYIMNETDLEKRLDGLDEDTRKKVRKHMDEFHTVEEMEMFIKQKTRGGEE